MFPGVSFSPDAVRTPRAAWRARVSSVTPSPFAPKEETLSQSEPGVGERIGRVGGWEGREGWRRRVWGRRRLWGTGGEEVVVGLEVERRGRRRRAR